MLRRGQKALRFFRCEFAVPACSAIHWLTMAKQGDHCTDTAACCPKGMMLNRYRARPSLDTGRDSQQASCIRQVIADDNAPASVRYRSAQLASQSKLVQPIPKVISDSRPKSWANSVASQKRRKCCTRCYSGVVLKRVQSGTVGVETRELWQIQWTC